MFDPTMTSSVGSRVSDSPLTEDTIRSGVSVVVPELVVVVGAGVGVGGWGFGPDVDGGGGVVEGAGVGEGGL